MKRVLTIVCALALAASTASAQIEYGFKLSGSNTDPNVNVVPAFASFVGVSVHLWMDCSVGDGISAAEFDLNYVAPASVFGWAFTPLNGWLNAGGTGNLLLAVGGCPTGPVLVGSWSGFNTGGPIAHNFCLVPSAATGSKVGVDCSSNPAAWPAKAIGLAAGVENACAETLCGPTSVESETWGSIKSLYR